MNEKYENTAASQSAPGKRPPMKLWQRVLAAAVFLAVVAAVAVLRPKDAAAGALLDLSYPAAYAFDDYETRRTAWEENPVDDSFLASLQDFSYETAADVLSKADGNQNFAPLSLYYALALAASGAEGETAAEFQALLGVSDTAYLHTQCGNLYRQLYTDNEIGKLLLANSLWIDDGFSVKDSFVSTAAQDYYASVFRTDMSSAATEKAMADWIAAQTKGRLTPEIQTGNETVLSILNTVYFNDQWIDRFDSAATAAGSFNLADGSTINCDFMNRSDFSHGYAKGNGFTRSSLGLKNGGSMVFILPDAGLSPQSLLSDAESIRTLFEGGEDGCGEVIWQIPKFDFSTQLALKETLQTLGLEHAFRTPESGDGADFSGMLESSDAPGEGIFLEEVRQNSSISIDEEGVEAAAFTQIDYCGAAPPDGRAEMILDRPFIYGIKAQNGSLLFIGICADPSAA